MKNCVVISGLPGAGKSVLTDKLSKSLGWPVFSVGKLWRQKYNEKYPKGEISFEEFWKTLSREEQEEMNQRARTEMQKGNVIGEFRFAKSCEGIDALFVFVTSDLDVRVKRAFDLGKYPGKDELEIKRILKSREEDEVRIGKESFGESYDYRDVGNYEILLDSGELSVDEEAKFVLGLLEGKDKKEIIKEMRNLKI